MNTIYILFLFTTYIVSISADNSIAPKILDTMMDKPAEELFKIWHFLYKKEYSVDSSEGKERFEIFAKKLNEINNHNSDSTNTWKLGLNQFSDLSSEEFTRIYLKPLDKNQLDPIEGVYSSNGYYEKRLYYTKTDGPKVWNPIDWRTKCGKVFDQGSCGSCYAFSMINSIECNYNIAKGSLPELSRQQIVDCNTLTGGCDGGNPQGVAFYAKSQGLMTNAKYPYKARVSTCAYSKSMSSIYVDGVETNVGTSFDSSLTSTNPFFNSNAMYDMLTRGSLSVCLDATPTQNYKSGIIDLRGCSKLNHAVMLVGYGIENNVPYWIIKNSWNTWWGEQGYMRVKVKDDSQGNCFLYTYSYRPFKD